MTNANNRKQADLILNEAYTAKINAIREFGIMSDAAKTSNELFKTAKKNANTAYGYTRYN